MRSLELREENESIKIKLIINVVSLLNLIGLEFNKGIQKPMVSGMYLCERVTFKLP